MTIEVQVTNKDQQGRSITVNTFYHNGEGESRSPSGATPIVLNPGEDVNVHVHDTLGLDVMEINPELASDTEATPRKSEEGIDVSDEEVALNES